MSEYKCYVTIDNTHNPNNLVLVSSNPSGSYVTPPPGILPAGKTVKLELLAAWDEGPSDTLVWTSGVAPNQATITMTFADPFVEENEAALSVSGSQAALLAYGVSYFYASAGDTSGGQPMQRDAIASWGDPVRINYSVVQNAWASQPSQWLLKGIKRVVWYMLENRSLDHLLGQLYTENTQPPQHFYPQGSTPKFNGLGANPTFSNTYKNTTVTARPVPSGKDDTPNPDPFEVWEHVNVQIYPNWPSKSNPVMGGFLQDYFGQDSRNPAQIMQFYTPVHVPVISYLAQLGAVSDAWFCSAPTETYANRAFSIAGTSDGLVDNVVSADPPFYANTVFNIMANCGFNGPNDWGIYANDTWPPLDSNPDLCFTTFQFQALYDLVGDNNPKRVFNWDDLINGAKTGTLPAFCYVEPAWYIPYLGNGTDYHPPANLTPGEGALLDLYNALRRNQGWNDTLLIVTFDEHGGNFDHVPPYGAMPPNQDQAIAPDNMSAAPQNFNFKRMGVRVPTILISPHVQNSTVFRSNKGIPFDHTSLLKTILGWRGIDVSRGTAGARTAAAPDFSGVVLPTMVQEAEAQSHADIDLAPQVKPSDKQRPLSGLEQSMAGFWAYKITGGKRGNPEHLELTARIANAKTVAEMEEIVYAAVAAKRARGGEK